MKIKYFISVLVGVAFISFNVFAEPSTDRRPTKEKWNHIEVKATVQTIDLEKREITLMDTKGNLVTTGVDEGVKRFNEIEVGDVVTAEYWAYMMAEFRDPTPDELKVPLVIVAEGGKAPEGMDPAVKVGAIVKAVVTIEIINRPFMAVTIKGPKGKYVTLAVEDQDLIKQLNVGEVVIMTYAEAMALSLEKVE